MCCVGRAGHGHLEQYFSGHIYSCSATVWLWATRSFAKVPAAYSMPLPPRAWIRLVRRGGGVYCLFIVSIAAQHAFHFTYLCPPRQMAVTGPARHCGYAGSANTGCTAGGQRGHSCMSGPHAQHSCRRGCARYETVRWSSTPVSVKLPTRHHPVQILYSLADAGQDVAVGRRLLDAAMPMLLTCVDCSYVQFTSNLPNPHQLLCPRGRWRVGAVRDGGD